LRGVLAKRVKKLEKSVIRSREKTGRREARGKKGEVSSLRWRNTKGVTKHPNNHV